MMTDGEIIIVVQGKKDGKEVQCRKIDVIGPWKDNPNPLWTFSAFDYRIKPEARHVFVNFCSNGDLSHCVNRRSSGAAGVHYFRFTEDIE
jgi:hypothetical protein